MRTTTLVLAVLALTGGTAIAQERYDVSAGYRFMRSEGVSYPAGWYVDATAHLNTLLSVVGEVGGAYKSDSIEIGAFSQSVDAKVHTFLGGVKARAVTMDEDVIAFGQALLGVANQRLTTTSGSIRLSRSTTDPAFSLSAGVDVNDLPVGLRFQIGWVRAFEEGDGSNVFHFSVGARFGF
jgi:hypothetical protein